jgi:hypothetical protein
MEPLCGSLVKTVFVGYSSSVAQLIQIPAFPGFRTSELPKRIDIEAALRRLAPRIPPHELGAVVDHALDSPGLRGASPEAAAWLSLVAYVRHVLTDYDELLEQGYDVDSARHFVTADIDAALARWGVRRRLSADD